MARFIVVHGTPEQATQDELIRGAKKVTASLPTDTKWLNSWSAGKAEKLFCEWEAPDAEAIRASLKPVTDLFPIDEIHEVVWINPEWYK
jgi:hypothetical protein